MLRRGSLAAVMLALAAGCGDNGSEGRTATAATRQTEATTTEPAETASSISERCMVVPPAILQAIETGIRPAGRTLHFAQAVRSLDYGSVFFISAEVQGKGMAGADDIATWAGNNLNIGGLFLSINPVAEKVSRWGLGKSFDKTLTMKADGARLSQRCTKSLAG